MESRTATAFPEAAVLHCHAGTMALKGNLPDNARASFQQALALNPLLWEAFEGLCALGGSLPTNAYPDVADFVQETYPTSRASSPNGRPHENLRPEKTQCSDLPQLVQASLPLPLGVTGISSTYGRPTRRSPVRQARAIHCT